MAQFKALGIVPSPQPARSGSREGKAAPVLFKVLFEVLFFSYLFSYLFSFPKLQTLLCPETSSALFGGRQAQNKLARHSFASLFN
jgi:hypothetical protein